MTKSVKLDERKVKTYMAVRGINTYKDLSEKAGFHYSTIRSMLIGNEFRSSTLEGIANALDVNPLDLLVTEGYPPPHMGAPAIA